MRSDKGMNPPGSHENVGNRPPMSADQAGKDTDPRSHAMYDHSPGRNHRVLAGLYLRLDNPSTQTLSRKSRKCPPIQKATKVVVAKVLKIFR
jgi:hypothetical protein